MKWEDELREAEDKRQATTAAVERLPDVLEEKMDLLERLGEEFVKTLGWVRWQRSRGQYSECISLERELGGGCLGKDSRSGIMFYFPRSDQLREEIRARGKPFITPEIEVSTYGFATQQDYKMTREEFTEQAVKKLLKSILEDAVEGGQR